MFLVLRKEGFLREEVRLEKFGGGDCDEVLPGVEEGGEEKGELVGGN